MGRIPVQQCSSPGGGKPILQCPPLNRSVRGRKPRQGKRKGRSTRNAVRDTHGPPFSAASHQSGSDVAPVWPKTHEKSPQAFGVDALSDLLRTFQAVTSTRAPHARCHLLRRKVQWSPRSASPSTRGLMYQRSVACPAPDRPTARRKARFSSGTDKELARTQDDQPEFPSRRRSVPDADRMKQAKTETGIPSPGGAHPAAPPSQRAS